MHNIFLIWSHLRSKYSITGIKIVIYGHISTIEYLMSMDKTDPK